MHGVRSTNEAHVTLLDGRRVEIIERIGRGSVGAVYRGMLESGWGLRKPVAVKVFSLGAECSVSHGARELGRAARRLTSARHSVVIETYELGNVDDEAHTPFAVNELVEGESLANLMAKWRANDVRVPVDFATVVLMRVAEGLGAALFAERPDGTLTALVHGDLSPRQVLISREGEVKLGDFGHSMLLPMSNVRSQKRLAHTAPEIAGGGPASSRSDVFSLGVILHELLIGPRFPAEAGRGTILEMVHDGSIETPVFAPNLPRSLRDVLATATAADPRDRYPHAQAFAFDLRREMLRLGLLDAQTCVRQNVVTRAEEERPSIKSEVVPRIATDECPALPLRAVR